MSQFEQRKKDHIDLSLSSESQSRSTTYLEHIELRHEALPDLDFSDIDLKTTWSGHSLKTPFLISSMTLGHGDAKKINHMLAEAASSRGWMMGVGSQRKQLTDPQAHQECMELAKAHPKAFFLGNLGMAQLIQSSTDEILKLVDSLGAKAMIIHTNPLQECIQPEGTPQFQGSLKALKRLCKELPVPVILKETGSGFSKETILRFAEIGLSAVDVSGKGGTHWGKIESMRASEDSVHYRAGKTFSDWGVSTVQSLENARQAHWPREKTWASGGVRSGLDAAKLIALGASIVGVAQPLLKASQKGADVLDQWMSGFEYEFKTAMFCTGSKGVKDLEREELWQRTPHW